MWCNCFIIINFFNYTIMINKAILVGNVGKDPEVRYLEKGTAVANFPLATTKRGYTMQNGTQVPDRTEWHNIVVWGALAKVAEQYVRKGRQLYIEGRIQTRSWEKDGIKRYTTEIVAETLQMLGKRSDYQDDAQFPAEPDVAAPADSTAHEPMDGADDLPF